MKAGAHDFINKGKLAKLVPVVSRELNDAEVRIKHRAAELTAFKVRKILLSC